jgi:hypothetical protein
MNQMLAFIQSQPSVIERILSHIETPSFVDLLLRIIQLDEIPAGAGVLEVCPSLATCLRSLTCRSGFPQKISWVV